MKRAVAIGVLMLTACGGTQSRGTAPEELVDGWDCRSRRAEYALVGGFVAAESGVSMWCDDERGYLEDWRVSKTGERTSKKRNMTQVDFEDMWKKLDSAGWRNLGDCDNPDAGDADPIYTIAINDHAVDVSLTCQGKEELPFPYNRIINELDLKAAGFTQ